MKSQVAIDGPVASGKTVVGRAVSQDLKWKFLDTGVMYRAATRIVLDLGLSLNNNPGIIFWILFKNVIQFCHNSYLQEQLHQNALDRGALSLIQIQ